MPVANALPRWDLTPYFPGVQSSEFEEAVRSLNRELELAEEYWRASGIASSEGVGSDIAAEAVGRLSSIQEQSRLIAGYLECLVTTDSNDNAAAAALSSFDQTTVRISKLKTLFTLWIGKQTDLDFGFPTISEHAFYIERAQLHSKHLMDAPLESLVSELQPSGSTAWSRLHSNFTSQIQVQVDGERLPMTAVRNIAYSPDREKRRKAYEAELSAWKLNELPLAACLNSIKGEVNSLADARGWHSPLEEALFNAHIDRESLDAMMEAANDAFPQFRRYLSSKAKAIGHSKLAFFDLFAPIGDAKGKWAYPDACKFVADNFERFSPELGDFARRNFRENWIDAEPRNGKVGGAYCCPMIRGESRILMNYEPSYGSVSVLAHELGHGYHDMCLSRRSPLNQDTPMTLAETASIFCETIMKEAALGKVAESDQLAILEASLQSQCQVVVDISSRFLFESAVFEGRRRRELSADELCKEMLAAQEATYGDGLDPEFRHPYMWAVKPHYYSTSSFYNFPYMFGLLFGLGLYSIYQSEPSGFQSRYAELLSSTGLADARTLADRFGINIQRKEFWAASLDQIRRDIDRFESLI
ncbi:MAG TPA: M3 family oligoendopeptidase [Fimbriimonadaceae bacterium]|nr:M3 family oligoendopeptidase [Fimbriimonadaceae bacterium]